MDSSNNGRMMSKAEALVHRISQDFAAQIATLTAIRHDQAILIEELTQRVREMEAQMANKAAS